MHAGFSLDLKKPNPSTTASSTAATAGSSVANTETPSVADSVKDTTATAASQDSSKLFESESEVQIKLADIQADPNSPLYSVKSFDQLGLSKELLQGIYAMKFVKPSKIQERALPLLLTDPPTNLIGQSQSGTGKTAAFALTILSRVDYSINKPQAICLAPARELARQNYDVIREMGKYTEAKVMLAVRDEAVQTQEDPKDFHIIVGTPGTIFGMARSNRQLLQGVKVFVLDEADNMLGSQGLSDQCIRIKSLVPRNSQFVLFSATFPPQIQAFAARFAPNANQMLLKAKEVTVKDIKQYYIRCEPDQKLEILGMLYDLMSLSQSIIFSQRRDTADRITRLMAEKGNSVISLHGKQDPSERDRIMDEFREGKTKVLVSTNVLSRGIDIAQVSMVVNYDMPADVSGFADTETYVHRIGRTGRFGRTGVSINLIDNDSNMQIQRVIEEELGITIKEVPTDDWEEAEKILRQSI